EKNYGGLIKGFMAIAKEKKKLGQKAEAGPGGILHSFDGGMYSLIEALRGYLDERVITNKKAISLEKRSNSYIIHFKDGSVSEADIVVLAIPAYSASALLKDFDKGLSDYLNQIQYPPLTVVSLGFKNIDLSHIDLNGFGFLVPAREKRKILGTLFDTSIFPNRAPEGYTLIRTMVGGARYPELALLEDKKIQDLVLSELKDIVGLKAEPIFVKIFRWNKAIPQYNVGHHMLLENIESLLTQHKGLFLTGNAYKGVAVNDCIANSVVLASQIKKGL
ncbi:MAG: protoporphyrinogen oxidase, partial [Thermodesulfovibrionales bacterium]|nr:protoporphyrinogen oxidase [Thermodesulfovibrionales bacterium]